MKDTREDAEGMSRQSLPSASFLSLLLSIWNSASTATDSCGLQWSHLQVAWIPAGCSLVKIKLQASHVLPPPLLAAALWGRHPPQSFSLFPSLLCSQKVCKMLQMVPSACVGKYASWSFVTHKHVRVKLPVKNAFIFATDYFLSPALGKTRETSEVIFVLENSNEMRRNYQKISLLKSKHQKSLPQQRHTVTSPLKAEEVAWLDLVASQQTTVMANPLRVLCTWRESNCDTIQLWGHGLENEEDFHQNHKN